nr:phospholipase D alpha 1-like [Arachis hypogaea]
MAAVLLNGTIQVVISGIENGTKAGSITSIAQKNTGKHETGYHVAIFVGQTKFFSEAKKWVGLPTSLFPQRIGCQVTLFQDAHTPADFVQRKAHAGLGKYESHGCWEDMFDKFIEAKLFIYIAAWSLDTEITLIRDPPMKPGSVPTLGELLKKKAADGVRVVLLLWNDITAVRLFKNQGLMGTCDKETERYFKDTGVECVLRTHEKPMCSHHEKVVIVDSPLPNIAKRILVCYIEGLDLCKGRFDTPSHPLFSTLGPDGEHSRDFHQPNFKGTAITKGGPREPWHDVHCRLEGPVAWDVYDNFVESIKKEGKEDLLVPDKQVKDVISDDQQIIEPNRETWNVQLFRSTTVVFSEAAGKKKGFWNALVALARGKNKKTDRSIHDACIYAIRAAEGFIYIENQYFIGSSSEKNDASHQIAKELTRKIVSKIKAKERFAVYVVIPMWPEGIPESSCVQKMLDLQKRTIEKMYRDISQAIKEAGIDEEPQNYLAFFCLGNREVKKHGEYEPPVKPSKGSSYQKAQEARRFMIYVHSKLMIVDDEYMIIGSANINQRSMDGGRDTEIEIGMGAYQPYYLASGPKGATGQVHGFRRSLWLEHLGKHESTFLNPESKPCIEKVNQLAEQNWKSYIDISRADLHGHLLRYPYLISDDGTITELPGFEFFPDTNAKILGKDEIYMRLPFIRDLLLG